MNKCFPACIAFLLAAIFHVSVYAEDIDLYTSLPPGASASDAPTVLLVWDNAANTSASATGLCTYSDTGGAPSLGADKAAGMEQCAMVNALIAIKDTLLADGVTRLGEKIKVGLMIFNKNGFSNNGNGQCGYLQYAPQIMNSTNANALISMIKGFRNNTSSSILANGASVGTTMAEAWAMLNGKTTSCSGVNYASLYSTPACRDATIVYIGNAFGNSNPGDGVGGADTLLKNELTNAFGYALGSANYSTYATPMAVAGLNTSGNANNSYWADEWTRFMHDVNTGDSAQSDRNIVTYTISVTSADTNQAQAQSVINYYGNMAAKGGGDNYKVTLNEWQKLRDALMTIFNKVQAVNSVFASAALPVSANTQGSYQNQVYIAMFRPDPTAHPRWYGNIKQYQLGFDAAGKLVLTDSQQNPDAGPVTSKTNSNTGTISPEAISFWTRNDPQVVGSATTVSGWPADGFWRNASEGYGKEHDSPDGDLVQKGGAAQMARVDSLTATYADANNDNPRKLLTCNAAGSCASTLTNFDTANSALTSNSLSLFGVPAASSSSANLSAGTAYPAAASTGSCTVSGCNVSATGTVAPTAGSAMYNNISSGNGSCPVGSSTCTILTSPAPAVSGSTTTFAYSSGNGNQSVSAFTGRTFYVPGSIVTVSLGQDLGLQVGDKVTLSSCTIPSSDTSGFSAIGADPYTVISASGTTFTFSLGSNAVTTNGATVSCTVNVALYASRLINWIRGWDVAGNEEDHGPCNPAAGGASSVSGCTVTVRPSLQGDVLHSRPAVVNYATSASTNKVVVFYGSNDGVFRAINGNKTDPINGVRAGGELWGFVAPEFFGKFKRLYNNTPLVKINGVLDSTATPKDYFFDGTTSVLRDTRTGTATAGKTHIYLTARRGGRLIYALDVTDPASPSFLWKKSDADIPELGQTWSEPKVALVRGYSNPVLIFGAGYDTAEDADPQPATSAIQRGRGVVILDAVTGGVVWAALNSCTGVTTVAAGNCVTNTALTRSIPADITLLDRNSDGYVDRLYAADLGANIWRIDLEPRGYGNASNVPSTWVINKLAALGGTGNAARKFFYPPDVIPTSHYDAVVAVSGDREHPLYTSDTTAGLAYNVVNRVYMIEDKSTGALLSGSFTALTESDLLNSATPYCLNALSQIVTCTFNSSTQTWQDSTGATVTAISSYTGLQPGVNGYYVTLGTGEKGVNAPVTVAGKVYFGTNQPETPSTASCSIKLGIAKAYNIEFNTGVRRVTTFAGGGMPPTSITGLVTIDGNNVPFIIGGSGPTPFDPATPDINLSGNRKRAFWYTK